MGHLQIKNFTNLDFNWQQHIGYRRWVSWIKAWFRKFHKIIHIQGVSEKGSTTLRGDRTQL